METSGERRGFSGNISSLDDLFCAALDKRESLLSGTDDDCFRVFNSSGDGMEGLTVDVYGEYLLVQFFHESLFNLENMLVETAVRQLQERGKPVRGALLKKRMKAEDAGPSGPGKSMLIYGENPPSDLTVLHNGMRLHCDLVDYQSTGVFMDMRDVRNSLREWYASCSSMLNLFSHTGAFSVHARKYGIEHCVNVDLSRSIHRRAKLNHSLNGIACDDRDFICGDVGDWISRFRKKKSKFSLIVYDPPTFSRNKKSVFSVRRNFKKHVEFLQDICDGGYVMTCINTFSIGVDEYLSFHPKGLKNIFLHREAPDFRYKNESYLKAGLWRV
jgi:23S rRNA (cytosine1962-C5)-methyltransferase